MEELSDELPAESQPFVDYFEDTYVDRPQHRGRHPPIFGNDLWNMFDQAQDELLRTNNSVEGWHRSNFWNFVDFTKRDQALQ